MSKEKWKRLLPAGIFLLLIVSLVMAIVLLVLSGKTDIGYKKHLLRIAGIILLLMAGMSVCYLYLLRENDPNFFLYDQKTQKNMSPDDLTFSWIDERMEFYLSLISATTEELWQGDVLASDDQTFGKNGVYRPLVVYKMLYDLTVLDDDETWKLLENADSAKVGLLVRALRQCNDTNMAEALVALFRGDVQDGENVRDFLTGNQKYLRGRMIRYVKDNLDYFY